MAGKLERRYGFGHHHFVTFSCYQRRPHLADGKARDVFETSLERVRRRYRFTVDSYVVMPEHVHLLVSEPQHKGLSVAVQALKISVSKRLGPKPFWQHRFYDFNVFTDHKWIEKRRYIHRNPFTRGLVAHPKDCRWSSYRAWAYAESTAVQVESTWVYAARMQEAGSATPTSCKPTSQNRDVGTRTSGKHTRKGSRCGHPPAAHMGCAFAQDDSVGEARRDADSLRE